MPILNITQKDIDRQKQCSPGTYKFRLNEVEEKSNRDKDGINYIFDFEVISEGDNLGRHNFPNISSKLMRMAIPLVAALLSLPEDNLEAGQFNADAWIGKEIWAEIYIEIYENKPQARMRNFASGTSKPAF